MIRCLLVDDSPTFRSVLRELLATARDVEVIGEAGDGDEAIRRVLELRPDVVTMDVRMPRRDGLAAIKEIMRLAPTPIVVVSAAASDTQEGVSFQALKLGAVEVLEKPQAISPERFAAQAEAIRQAVRAVAGLTLATRHREPPQPPPRPVAPGQPRPPPACVGIVASTGGPPALARVLGALPASFPVPVLVVQHIAPGFCDGLARWLSSQCALRVRLARRGEPLEPGSVLLAPDDAHLMVSLGRVRLDAGAPIKGLRPSGTALLASLAREYGPAAVGLVLTGMGDDGAAGLRLMRERGAVTWAQGPSSSVVYGMPRAALECGAAEAPLELDEIPAALVRLVGVEPAALRATTTPLPFASRPRVLLVEDSETVLQAERALLAEFCELLLARDGREGLELARRHRPDAILLDHALPRLTGADVLRALRADPATRAIPVVVVSSETEPAIVEGWWKAGCQAVVSKPFDGETLVAAVRRVVLG